MKSWCDMPISSPPVKQHKMLDDLESIQGLSLRIPETCVRLISYFVSYNHTLVATVTTWDSISSEKQYGPGLLFKGSL